MTIQAIHGWASDRIVPICVVIANGSGWAVSYITANVSVGSVVAFCTVAVPAGVGAFVYIVQKAGPVWIQYRKDLDATRSASLAGQMERLNQNLETSTAEKVAQTKLAEIAGKQADRLAESLRLADARADAAEKHAASLDESLRLMSAEMAKLNLSLVAARESLHTIRDEAGADRTQRVEAERELRDIKAKFGLLTDQIAPQVAKNSAAIAEAATKVEAIAHFGSKVGEAADLLVHPDPPIPDPTTGDHR